MADFRMWVVVYVDKDGKQGRTVTAFVSELGRIRRQIACEGGRVVGTYHTA